MIVAVCNIKEDMEGQIMKIVIIKGSARKGNDWDDLANNTQAMQEQEQAGKEV